MEEVRKVAGGGCGGDKVHLGSTTLSQGIDQSQVGRNICCVVSEQQDRLQERRGLEGCWICRGVFTYFNKPTKSNERTWEAFMVRCPQEHVLLLRARQHANVMQPQSF